MRYIVFLGDGMADLPVAELDGRTPLQVARKPAIDRIARLGRCGRFVTVEEDMPPGSEVANLTVLGYDPRECYQGRGVIEAAAMGVELSEDALALRCNLICLEDGRIRNHSAGHIPTGEAEPLIRAMNRVADELAGRGLPRCRFHPGISYRHLCVVERGSPDIECFPPHDHLGEDAADLLVRPLTGAAGPTVELLNLLVRRSWEVLPGQEVNRRRQERGQDQANSVWFWSQGRKPRMKTYREMFGLSGAVISAVDLIRGLGIYAGLDVLEVEGATGLIDTNYEGKADACLAALADHDFVFVHVEATDEAAHARNLKQKILGIEYLDSRLVSRVMKGLEDCGVEATVAVLPDHLTPVAKGNHVHGPVPVAIAGPSHRPDPVECYDEVSVRKGSLGLIRGDRFIRLLLGR